jgi:hypothetical protein
LPTWEQVAKREIVLSILEEKENWCSQKTVCNAPSGAYPAMPAPTVSFSSRITTNDTTWSWITNR